MNWQTDSNFSSGARAIQNSNLIIEEKSEREDNCQKEEDPLNYLFKDFKTK